MSIMFKLANNLIQGAHGFNSIVVSFVMTVFLRNVPFLFDQRVFNSQV